MRLVIAAVTATTTSCASLPPAHALPGVSDYSVGLVDDRPSLLCIPDLVTVLPPLRRRAPWGHPPDSSPGILPSPERDRLRALNTRNCLHAGELFDVAAIPLRYGPVTRSPSWAVPSCDGESFILGAFVEAVTRPRRPIRYAAVRLLPLPVLPRLVRDGCRLHLSPVLTPALSPFRAPYAERFVGAAFPGASRRPWPSPVFTRLGSSLVPLAGACPVDAAGFT